MVDRPPLNPEQTDNGGIKPSQYLYITPNSVWYNKKSGNQYKVTEWRWDAERKRWLVCYEPADAKAPHLEMPQLFSRGVVNFLDRNTQDVPAGAAHVEDAPPASKPVKAAPKKKP